MKKFLSSLALVSTAVFAQQALAAPLLNGSFDDASAWVDVSYSGSTDISGGVASLSTGAGTDPFSAVLVQGDDGFFSFSNPVSVPTDALTLSFDVRMDQVVAGDESGFGFGDFLTVALYDAMDFSYDTFFFGDGFDFSVDSLWTTVSLDISALAGRDLAISFELTDEDDGFDSTVFLDNVEIAGLPPVQVSEPGSLVLMILGLAGLVASRRRAKA